MTEFESFTIKKVHKNKKSAQSYLRFTHLGFKNHSFNTLQIMRTGLDLAYSMDRCLKTTVTTLVH